MTTSRKGWFSGWFGGSKLPTTPPAKEEPKKDTEPKKIPSSTHLTRAALANPQNDQGSKTTNPIQTENDPLTLVAEQLERLKTLQTKSIERKTRWMQEKEKVVSLGAEGDTQPKDENHEPKQSFLGALYNAVKHFCEPAEKYIHEELEVTLGKHISELHGLLKNQIDELNRTNDQKQLLAIKLRICNTMIDLNTERQLLAEKIKTELESCLKAANIANLAFVMAWTILIRSIISLPVPTPDFQIVENYTRCLGDRIKPEVVNEETFDAELDGVEDEAFKLVDNDSRPAATDSSASKAEVKDAIVENPPLRKLSGAGQAVVPLPIDSIFARPVTPSKPSKEESVVTRTYGCSM